MTKPLRIALVAMFVLLGGLSLHVASAQMMHFNLDITIQTEDGADLPDGGQVCVSGEVNPICQDIGGNPSGRDFFFEGLADGDHQVTITADPYLEIVDTVNLSQDTTSVSYTLQREQTPPTAAPTSPSLPNTGAGTTMGTGGTSDVLVLLLATLAVALVTGSAVQLRKRR